MKCIANNFLIEMCFEHFLKYNCIENARGRIVGSQLSMQMLQKKQVSHICACVYIRNMKEGIVSGHELNHHR